MLVFFIILGKRVFSISGKENDSSCSSLRIMLKLLFHDELAVEVARRLEDNFCTGLRNSQDLDYEGKLNFFNHELALGIGYHF